MGTGNDQESLYHCVKLSDVIDKFQDSESIQIMTGLDYSVIAGNNPVLKLFLNM